MIIVLLMDISSKTILKPVVLDDKAKRREKREMLIIRLVGLLFFIISVYYLIVDTEYYQKVLMVVMVITIGGLLIFSFLPTDIISFQNQSYVLVFGVFSILFFIIFKTSLEIGRINRNWYKGTIVKTADSTYTSIDSSYFIGKTEGYIFIYNKKDTTTSIIPTSEVKSIIIKHK